MCGITTPSSRNTLTKFTLSLSVTEVSHLIPLCPPVLLKHHIQRKDAEQDVSKTIEKGFADTGIALHYKKKIPWRKSKRRRAKETV